jgi:hypothetical protein
MTNGEKLEQVFPDGICPFSQNWLKTEYKESTTKNDLGVDCISRTRAIERLKLNFPISEGADNSRDRHRYMQALADLQAIRELPSVTQQEPRWIPVSERLPEENICDDGYHEPSERVLAYMKSGEMHVARYWSRYDYKWLGIITPTTDEVLAWMPLPKAYREVEE